MSEQWEVVARQVFATKAEAEEESYWLGLDYKCEVHLLPWVLEIPDASPSPNLEEIAEVL